MAADRPGAHQKTVGTKNGYETKGFVAEMCRLGFTPDMAQNNSQQEVSARSINARRGSEKVFSWI